MAIIELCIPESSPSLNRTHGKHWGYVYRLKRRWELNVVTAKLEARIYGRPEYPQSRVTIERHGARMLDPDNFTGGLKVLIDGLKNTGLILDDSPKHIELSASQHIGKPHRTLIRIEPKGDLQ